MGTSWTEALGRHLRILELIEISLLKVVFEDGTFNPPKSLLRKVGPAYAFSKYLIKNHKLVQFSKFIDKNDQ